MSPLRFRVALALLFAPALVHCTGAVEPEQEAASSESSSADELVEEPSLTFGTWISPTCETVDDTTFQLRTYRIAANGVFADWKRFSSPSCEAGSELMTLRMGGSSKIDRVSRTLAFTAEIRVFIDEKAIVPLSQAGIERLQQECARDDWRVGSERDVTREGCGAILPAREACPIEYDLMRLRGRQLFFGDRGAPLCTEATRPTELSVWSVRFDHAL